MIPLSDAVLSVYLEESLPVDQLSEIERRLREDDGLRQRLIGVIRDQELGIHHVGAIWRRHRLSCPDREDWGRYLLGVLDPETERYHRFHLDQVGCRYCAANFEDLREAQRSQQTDDSSRRRRQRYFATSAGRLRSG